MDILIIGCGVSGLTTGVCLQRAGHTVRIWAKELPPHTTSNIAAAVWYPYKAYPAEKVTAWGKKAIETFKEMRSIADCGVFMTTLVEARPAPGADPWWAGAVDGFRHTNADELPPGYADGYLFIAPTVDTGIYLDYLVRTLQAQGGQIVQRAVTNLTEAFDQSNVVVNCSGLGARELVGDRDLHAARGQTVRIKHNGSRRALLDEVGPNALAYIVPRTNDIVLGGTYEEGDESIEVDPTETQAILRRCAKLSSEFASVSPADILSVQCGLRPVRSTVRVEAERVAPDRLLLHNYGHGGAGITLSWGCSTEIVDLLAQMQGDREPRA